MDIEEISATQPDTIIRRYLRAARRAKALLVLDIQPGHADFLAETKHLDRWLREPDVGLALDPEWHTPGAQPGAVIGSVDAAQVNAVSAHLAAIEVRLNKVRSPFRTAERFGVEEIIDPRDTRKLLCEFANLAAPLRKPGPRSFGYRP